MTTRPEVHRRGRTVLAAAMVGCAALPVVGVAAAHSDESGEPIGGAPAKVADFNLTAVAGVVDFRVSYPDAVLPFIISGGMLESLATASGIGQAEGMAGPMPVPAANSGGLLAPTNVPGTEIPVPEEARKGYGSIDFTRFPNACLSRYPAIREGDAEAYCGGPALGDEGAGGTVATVNGHTTSTGDPDDPLQSRAKSVSRSADATVFGLQTFVRNGWAKAGTGLNIQDGVPESRAETRADELAFVGGVVRFTGVRSDAVVRTDGTDAGTSVQTAFAFQEASVGGIPVVVGPDGVSVREEKLGAGQSPREAAAQLSKVVKANDLEIRFVPAPPPIKENGQISVQSAGVEVVHRGSSVTPADSVYRFGFAAARGNAVAETGGSDVFGGGSSGHDDVLPANETQSAGGEDGLFDSGGLPDGVTAAAEPFDASAFTEGAGSFVDSVGPAPSDSDLTAVADAGPQPLPQEALPGRVALPAAALAAQPLPYNSLTRVFGGALAVALAAAAGLPIRRALAQR